MTADDQLGRAPTPFLEANALLAQQANDEDTVYGILDKMLPNELQQLADAADELAQNALFVKHKKESGTP